MTLIQIIRKFRRPFLFALSLVIMEKLAWIIEPTVFGRLLDALIAVFGSKERVSYAMPLVVWIDADVMPAASIVMLPEVNKPEPISDEVVCLALN